jgi:hypothetical protein
MTPRVPLARRLQPCPASTIARCHTGGRDELDQVIDPLIPVEPIPNGLGGAAWRGVVTLSQTGELGTAPVIDTPTVAWSSPSVTAHSTTLVPYRCCCGGSTVESLGTSKECSWITALHVHGSVGLGFVDSLLPRVYSPPWLPPPRRSLHPERSKRQ